MEIRTRSGRLCADCVSPRKPTRAARLKGDALTRREVQIAALVAEAKLNKEIAWELRLAEGTIKEYTHRIFRKLGVANRTELALWAVRNLPLARPDAHTGAMGFALPFARYVQ